LPYLRYVTTGHGPASSVVPGVERLSGELDARKYDQLIYGKVMPEWQLAARNFPDPGSVFWKSRSILARLREIQAPVHYCAGLRNDNQHLDVFDALDRD